MEFGIEPELDFDSPTFWGVWQKKVLPIYIAVAIYLRAPCHSSYKNLARAPSCMMPLFVEDHVLWYAAGLMFDLPDPFGFGDA